MASPDANTFSLTPPRRPGLDDFNGATKQDDPRRPPDPVTMPNAAEQNTVEKTLVGIGKTASVLKVYVAFTAGVPGISSFSACNDDLEIGDFVAPTDNGTGDTTVTIPSGVLPAAAVPPMAGIVGATPGCISVEVVSATALRVRTTTHAGAAADYNFVLYVD